MQRQFENHFNPDEIEQLALNKKFVQRKSKLDGCTFLSLIVFNSNSLHYESLNDLTIALSKQYGLEITKQGLDERFNAYAVKFLASALEGLLNHQLSAKKIFLNCLEFKRVLIKDSVCFQVDESLAKYYPGSGGSGSKANVRIQFEYDLLGGKIVDLSLNAFNEQDAKNSVLTLDVVNDGDLIIRDLAYMHLEALQGIVERMGHFLCRLNTQAKVYQRQNGKMIELNFSRIVHAMRQYNIQQTEETVFIGKNKELQVRLFIFKSWKSICKIDKVKKVKKDRLECYIFAKLLIIILCWRIAWFTGLLLKRHQGKNISYFKAFKTLMHDVATLKKVLVDGTVTFESYLAEFLSLSSRKHLLEKKKNRNYSPEVLCRSLTILEDGHLVAI